MIRPMTCPICSRELPTTTPSGNSFTPFCSERCKLVDFHRWWQGRYAIVEEIDPTNLPPDIDLEPVDDEE